MTLPAGTRFGVYEVLTLIGAGGMGEVYRARDTRLGRDVAVKILPSTDPELKARFEREARAIAALTHPHICTLYDVGQENGTDYLVMECLEGKTLAARIANGPIGIGEALTIATEIAGALDAAHRAGVVHRDLKPANVMLTKSGVKLLDFGLAKLRPEPHAVSGFSIAATATNTPQTAAGTILGTLAYMSPEQLEGHDVDARSDIFAFGIVLYECITGRPPFRGTSPPSVIASILKDEPRSITDLLPTTPPVLSRVVQTCLEKDPDRRWQSAGELKHALTWIAADAPAPPATGTPLRLWQGLAALFGVLAIVSAGWMLRPATPPPPTRLEVSLPANISAAIDSLSVSPDGRKLVLQTGTGLWIRSFDAVEWRRLAGTEGGVSPFWSPDGRYVAFGAGNELRKIDTTGGPPETICTVADYADGSGTWSRDGVIVFGSWGGGSGGPLWRVSQSGGAAAAITQVDLAKGELFHTWPSFLPDGKHFVYFRSGPPDVEGMYVGSLDAKAEEQSRGRILATALPAAYANGYLFFPRAGTLSAQRFDANRLQLQDAPLPIAETLQTTWYATGVFSVSPGGSLAYRDAAAGVTLQIKWSDRQGKITGTLGAPGSDSFVVLSPDGKRAVVKDSPYDVPGDLWTLDLSSGQRTRLTFRKEVYSSGVWSPDSARIAYAAGRFGDTLYERSASGEGGERELLKETGLRHFATNWSSDGRLLLYHTENSPKTGYDLWVLPVTGDRQKPVLLLGESFNEWAGVFSPDMRWLAYASLETGQVAEVFVRPFRASEKNGQPALGEGKWQISRNGGNWPVWHNAAEIIFHHAPSGGSVLSAPVKTSGAVFESGAPRELFAIPGSGGVVRLVDVTPDGQRFVMPTAEVERAARASITVVLNWPALVTK